MKNYFLTGFTCFVFILNACNNSEQVESTQGNTELEIEEAVVANSDSIDISNTLTRLLDDLVKTDYDAFIQAYDDQLTQLPPGGDTIVFERADYKEYIIKSVEDANFKVINCDVVSISVTGDKAIMKADYQYSYEGEVLKVIEDTDLELVWVNKNGWKITQESWVVK